MKAHIEAVRRMQQYIASCSDSKITLADLACVSHYSPWYAYRLFVRYLNLTPATYIRRVRLSDAALRLRDRNVTVASIAFATGFESADGFQRAFCREFGCNPRQYAKNPTPLYLYTPYILESTAAHKEKNDMSKTQTIFVHVTIRPARKVIIKRGIKATEYFSYCQEVGCDVWGLLTSIKSIVDEPVGLWLPKTHIKKNTSEYVQGVEVSVDYDGPVPEGFDVLDLPNSTYLMFQGEPFEEEVFEEAIITLRQAVENYNPSMIGYRFSDDQPRIQLEPLGERGYIEYLPVTKLT